MEKIELSPSLIMENLIYPLWVSIEKEYKIRYKRNIWAQFESVLRSSTYVASLQRFMEKFVRYLPCMISSEYVEKLKTISELGYDREILKEIREKTAYYVLLVRSKVQKEKEKIQKTDKQEDSNENLFV
ncbi:MAG: hypothetical protein N2517_09360 [Ignavibacteria bacterium]|nr:hypothetical protein [Ignavibacteria bacterium]